jgi:hypothetical protein
MAYIGQSRAESIIGAHTKTIATWVLLDRDAFPDLPYGYLFVYHYRLGLAHPQNVGPCHYPLQLFGFLQVVLKFEYDACNELRGVNH